MPTPPASSYSEPAIVMNFIASDGSEWFADHEPYVPRPGDFVYRAGKAYRVDEVWNNHEKHAAVIHGLVVFLDPVDVTEHRLGRQSPSYYKN